MKINKVILRAVVTLTAITLSVSAIYATTPVSDSESITVEVDVNEAISLTVNKSSVDLNTLTPSSSGVSKAADVSVTATVATNKSAGWELKIADDDDNNNLEKDASNFFYAHSGTAASPLVLGTGNVWGYRVDSWTDATKYAGVKVVNSGEVINSATSATTGTNTTIAFTAQLAANSTLAPGTYNDTVVLTAYTKT
jgi:spore coat protein U-like protein